MGRRPAGTGNLFVRADANGGETYYATWYADGRKVKRRIGAKRLPGTRIGLTKTQAEAELRRLIGEVRASVPRDDRITVEVAGDRYVDYLETVKGRKPTTITDYRTILRRHLVPFTAGRTIDAVDAAMIRSYVSAKMRDGLSAKTVRNHVVFAHGLFAYAVKRGWAAVNPVDRDDLPAAGGADPNIRYLGPEELEALYRATPDDDLGPTERMLYMTAAMTGLRLGELIALTWRRRGLARGRRARPPVLHPRRLVNAEVADLQPRRAPPRPARRRAGAPLSGLRVPARRRPRARPPGPRHGPRRIEAA